jgi:hypothetical protein
VQEGACTGAATMPHPLTLGQGLERCVFNTAIPNTKRGNRSARGNRRHYEERCVCLLLQDLVQRCLRGEGGDIGGHVVRETTGTLTQGVALFSLVPLVWESNPKLQGDWCKTQPPAHWGI